ncbi:MAG: class II aldolase/adducin family protein [Cyanobacteria bacterium]|nr:class II aldolase/adducin family protein [Cyanobacteriota bacterium]
MTSIFEKKKYLHKLKELELISSSIGAHHDYVQGGGGNTSVKLDDKLMAVKASGHILSDVTTDAAYAVVTYPEIVSFLQGTSADDKSYGDFVSNHTINSAKASMETGLHTILGAYVIHCHSTYSNLINCSKQAKQLFDELVDSDHNALWIKYRAPGYHLSKSISDEVIAFEIEHGIKPNILFLQNHGLVISADSAREALDLHTRINEDLKQAFEIESYPEAKLKQDGAILLSDSSYLKQNLRKYSSELSYDFFSRAVFPDQRIYLQNNIAFSTKLENKINIDLKSNTIRYKTNEKEALAIEETLIALFFIINSIAAENLNYISQESSQHLDNMDSEKYRKKVIGQ